MRHLIPSVILALACNPVAVFGQQHGAPEFAIGTYPGRPNTLESEPELSAAIADLLEAVRRRDASLVAPWLVDWSSYAGPESQPDAEPPAEAEGPEQEHEEDDDMGDRLVDMPNWDAGTWDLFGRSLRIGVSIDNDTARAPFRTENEAPALAVVVESANIHVAPDTSSPILATVGRVLVDEDGPSAYEALADGWIRVKASNGQRGYIEQQFVEQFLEFGIVFLRTPAGWRLAWLETGC